MILGQLMLIGTDEAPLFPMKTMALTQGINGGLSHAGSMAIDNAGEDGGVDRVYAPCTVKCSWKDKSAPNGVNWQTIKKVRWADGSYDYATIRIVHDNYIGDVNVGDIKRQGEVIGHEGVSGKVTGNHSHIGVARGLIDGQGLVLNSNKVYELQNEVAPYLFFWINGTIMKKTLNYPWQLYKAPQWVVGQRVKIIGSNYATGQRIPLWVKLRTLTIKELSPKAAPTKALLKEINSWVHLKDLKKV